MTVSSSTNRVSYSGNGSLTAFAYTFKVFDEDDLTVILRASDGTETVQTITTNYTVSGVGDAGGGNVTFTTAPASGVTVVILREQPLTQGLDLVPNDPFPAQSLEDQLDKLTFITQQHSEELGRAIKASKTNVITGAEFTISASDRANKVFAFDSSGDVSITSELGVYRGNWAAGVAYNQRDLVKDSSNDNIYLANTAHTSSGSTPLSSNADIAKWDLIVNAAAAASSASAAATSATAAQTAQTAAETAQTAAETAQTAAETAETNAETAQAAAEAAQAAAEAVYDNFDDRYLGAKATDPTLDNDGDALIDGALYFDTTNNVMKFYDLGNTQWKQTTPTTAQQTNIDAAVADATDIGLVAGSITNVNNVGDDITNVNTVAGQISPTNNISTVAGISTEIATVAGDSAAIGSLSAVTTEIGLLGVADVITDMGILGTADVVADMALLATTDVVADMALLGTSANVTAMSNVSDSIANVNTVATNITGVNSFAERYRVEATNPTTDLDAGDLAYVTGDTVLKYYNGTSWQSISPGIGAVSDDSSPSLGGVLSTSGNNIEFGDSTGAEVNRLKFGDGDDLEIYHDGTHNYIEAGSTTTNDLIITATDDVVIGHGTGASYETMATFLSDGSVNLYYNNSAKLATQNTGVYVTGDLTTSDDLFVNGGFASVSSASTAVFRLVNTDTTGVEGQELGVIDFYGSDSTSPGAGIKASIKGVIQGTSGNATSLQFSTTNSSNETLAIEIDRYGNLLLYDNNSIRFYDTDDSHFVGFDVPSSVTESYTITLPSVGPDADQILVSDTNGNTSWEDLLSERYNSVTSSSNATTIDLNDGTNFSHTLTENTTFTFSNPAASGRVSSFTLKLVQDASASGYTVAWPAAVDWPSATAPTLTATASAIDYFVFITHDGGTTWYGFTAGQALG